MGKKNGNGSAEHIEPNKEDDLDERALKLARETLTGDVRDIILNDMKERKSSVPWHLRREVDQQAAIDQVTRMAESIVSRVVKIVAAGGRRTIHASLKKVTVTNGIKAELELSKHDEQRHELINACGSSVLVVVADAEAYQGERAPVFAGKDQKSILGDEDGEAAHA